MATNDPSKTMFGISPFKLNDEESEKEAQPGPPAGAAAAAAVREADQASRRSLFFDEDGWDVPEERITGNFPAAGAAPVATPDLEAALGLADQPEPPPGQVGTGTMRFRPDQLMMSEPAPASAPETDSNAEARPFSGTMMFSAQNIAKALSGLSDEAPPVAPVETESSDAPAADTAQMRGLRDEDIEEARPPVESRPFTGTMRLRPIDLMAMEDGHKATQEVDLSFLASTTGAHDAASSQEVPRSGAGLGTGGTLVSAGGSVHGQPQWATMPVGAVIEAPDEEPPATGAHQALEPEPSQDGGSAESAASAVDDGATTELPPREPAPAATDASENADAPESAIEASPPATETRTDEDSVIDSTAPAPSHGQDMDLRPAPSIAAAAAEPAPAPVAESRRPAVTQPTQLMPALTLPPNIEGERDQVLNRLVAPTATPPSAASGETGPSTSLIILFVVVAIAILTLAAYFVLR